MPGCSVKELNGGVPTVPIDDGNNARAELYNRTIATYNPVSYMVEGIRSLVITGWDADPRLTAAAGLPSSRLFATARKKSAGFMGCTGAANQT